MTEHKYIRTPEAARRAGCSDQTIRRWAARYAIGHRLGGRFVIDAAKLDAMLRGQPAAEE